MISLPMINAEIIFLYNNYNNIYLYFYVLHVFRSVYFCIIKFPTDARKDIRNVLINFVLFQIFKI